MKLYIHPAACSLSPHIVARELGLDMEVIRVDRATHRAADGGDFLAINPNGYVPALVLDDGEILMEGPAIVQHLAEMNRAGGLVPQDPRERRTIQSLLNFTATELHKPMAQLFYPAYAPVADVLRSHVASRLDWVSTRFDGDFLTGDRLSLADIYLFVCLNWSQWLDIDLSRWPRLETFMRQMAERPAVLEAIEAEGLVRHPGGVFFAPRISA